MEDEFFGGFGRDPLPLWPQRTAMIGGAIDHMSPEEGLLGWVINMDEPEPAMLVQLICGDTLVAEVATSLNRDDVVEGLSVESQPGFAFEWSNLDVRLLEQLAAESPDALVEVHVPLARALLQRSPGNEALRPITARDVVGFAWAARDRREAAARAAAARRKAATEQRPAVSLQHDTIVACRGGTVLIVGWIDDRDNPMARLSVFAGADQALVPTAFGRVRRPDVEAALQAHGHLFGFWAVMNVGRALSPDDQWVLRAELNIGRSDVRNATARLVTEPELRTTILEYFATTEYFGSREIESYLALEAGIGQALVEMNRKMTNAIVAGAWVSYYGPVRKSYLGSIIVCLFGKHEFMFLQTALFTMGPRAREYEFIYVSNSPELTETLEKEARLCARIYGVSIVLVCLPDNAGFGAANNVAARYARSSRLMITNPDVFPRDHNWAQRHADIIEQSPRAQTAIFGVPLYYDDGSLMHHGMYFEVDAGISVRNTGVYARPMIRTEHYGKGAPVWAKFAAPRAVSATTGAFISADRDWFELLGGFTEDFLFGHYEDCDLCLKSYSQGQPVWVQDLPLWHMEGKGSVRRRAHEGGILVNRWIFTKAWGELIAAELNGPAPASLAAVGAPAEDAASDAVVQWQDIARRVS